MKITKKLAAAGLILAAVSGIILTNTGEEVAPDLKAFYKMSKVEQKAFQKAEIKSAKAGDEILSKREKSAKYFKGENGKMTAHISGGFIHYFDNEDSVYKEYDLTEREIDPSVKDNPARKYDKYIPIGNDNMSWYKNKKHDYRFDKSEGCYIRYEALFNTSGITIETLPNKTGVKQNYILYDDSLTELRWLIDTDAVINGGVKNCDIRFDNDDGEFQFTITKPIAWDASQNPVPVLSSVSGDTLIYSVKLPVGVVFPVTVDPTTQVTGAADGQLGSSSFGGAYTTARDIATANFAITTTEIIVGQRDAGGSTYQIRRGYISFAIPDMASVSACTLFAYGKIDQSTTDYDVQLFASEYPPTLATADWDIFDGHQSSGAYNGTRLNDPVNTSAFSVEGWNPFLFNSDGLSAVSAKKDGTLGLIFISSRDSSSTQPSDQSLVIYYSSLTGGKEPYLSFTYTEPPPPLINEPTSFSMTALSSTSIQNDWTNNGNYDTLWIFNSPEDTQVVQAASGSATTVNATGLDINTLYTFFVRADSSGVTGDSNADSLYTLVNPPVDWDFTNDVDDTTKVFIAFDDNGNPAATTFAIRDSTRQKWITATGDTSSTAVWLTEAQWEAIDIDNLTTGTIYRFGVVGKNGDDVETTYIWGTVIAGDIRKILLNIGVNAGNTVSGISDLSFETVRDLFIVAGPGKINLSAQKDTLGMKFFGAKYDVWRIGIQITGIPHADTIYSVLMELQGLIDETDTDFNWELREMNRNAPFYRESWYYDFKGYEDDLLPFTGTNLIETKSTSTFTTVGFNTLIFNQAGRDQFQERASASLDSAWYSLVSDRDAKVDSAGTNDPTGDEFVIYSSLGQIYMTYGLIEKIPINVTVTPSMANPDSIVVNWTDQAHYETNYAVVDSASGLTLATVGANVETARIGGLIPDTYYALRIKVIGGSIDGQYSDYANVGTYSAVLSNPVAITDITTSSDKVVIDSTGIYNSDTEIAIMYIDSSGDTLWVDKSVEPAVLRASLGLNDDWGWATYDDWGAALGDTITGLLPGHTYTRKPETRTQLFP